MSTLLKVLVRISLGMIVFLSLAAALLFVLVNSSLPDYDRSYQVTGIEGPVEIIRNEHNVPHIFGTTDADVYFGLGFVHAQDRLWQMVINRQFVQGRLSEIFGTRTLNADKLMHNLELYPLARETLEHQDADTQTALAAYAAGVNAWMNRIRTGRLGRGAPEFYIFDVELRPWTPVDSIALLSLNAFDLSPHIAEEVLRHRLLQRVPFERSRELLPMARDLVLGTPPIQAAARSPDAAPHIITALATTIPLARNRLGASNGWGILPRNSATGGSLLANDPHLGFTSPSPWMLARLELGSGGIIGATIPGIPLILLGRSNHLAWGLTYSYLDDQDLYFEKLDPTSSERYLTPAGYKDFERRVSVIAIKDNQPYSHVQSRTENGPVLDPSILNIADIVPSGHVVSLAWTQLEPANRTMTGAMQLMQAKSIDEAILAGRHIRAPSVNLLLADRNNIAMQTVGAAPVRHAFHETQGQLPAAGWKHRNRWQGEFPYEIMPRTRNPYEGYIINTNNRLPAGVFPKHLSHIWGDTLRIERLQTILKNDPIQSVDSTASAQVDVISQAARTIIPIIARDLWQTITDTTDDPVAALRSDALRLLRSWVGNMDEYSAEPLIYVAWLEALMEMLITDELGELASDFRRPNIEFIQRAFLTVEDAWQWCDIIQTTEIEDCEDIARLALDRALTELVIIHGSDIADWRWGNVHQASHSHTALGNSPVFTWLFDIRHPVPGGDHTLNRTALDWTADRPYLSSDGPGYRGIYDMANPDNSRFIIATGQSGHFRSRHYNDLGQLWRIGEYIPMSLNLDDARRSAIGTTLLEPTLNN